MIDATLAQLDAWYNEPSQGGDRPKLLSKLATLELCGWIEGELDRLVLLVEGGRLSDHGWVKENVISPTYGFTYDRHWRTMLTTLIGEVFARRVEERSRQRFPGELEQLKSLLGNLWKLRCDLAHADIAANTATQKTFNAPSWAINQHRILRKLLTHYEQAMLDVLTGI